jgi:antitoxin VapB
MPATVKLFMNGRSQAIRLPAQYRLKAQEVTIEAVAGGLWIQPVTTPIKNMGEWLDNFYAKTEPLPPDFLADREDLPHQERDWS